jgi:hypothetical protein
MESTTPARDTQPELTRAELDARFAFDLSTGIVTNRISTGRAKAGDVAGTVDQDGYLYVMIKGRNYRLHRVIFFVANGRWPSGDIDHVNGDVADNRPENIREATRSQNLQNRSSVGKGASRYLGVSFDKTRGKFVARICADGRKRHLGYHDNESAARDAYLAAKREHHTFAPIPRDLVSVEG